MCGLSQNATIIITNYDSYYKMRRYYILRQYIVYSRQNNYYAQVKNIFLARKWLLSSTYAEKNDVALLTIP